MATPEIPQHHGRPMTIVGAQVRCGVCGFESPVPPGGLEDPAPKHCGRTMHAVRHLRCDVCGEDTSDTLLLETPDTLYAPPPSPAAPPAEVADLVGEDWAGYRVVSKLGQGGMAVVYKAHQPSLNRYVAIKLLVPHGPPDPGLIQRFRQEAQLIAGLRHPNIVTVLDFGEEQGLPYLVMEFVEGETLAARMGRPLEVSAALAIAAQIGRALHYAHGEGVVHRDVKPSNVLLRGEDWALLSDFGIAKVLGSPLNLTQTGTAIGTPEYMAPEQCQGLGVDARSDIYSLGVVLYEMLTGRPPFTGDTPMSVMLKHVQDRKSVV